MEMIRNNRITTIYVRSYYSDGINGPRYDINSKWRGLCQICSIFHELKLKLITNQFRVLIVIIIRLSSRHHVCSNHCYHHSSVIKASCLFRSLLSSFVCHQGIMSVQILVIVIRLSSRHHVCSDHCYRHSSVIKASCLFRSLL